MKSSMLLLNVLTLTAATLAQSQPAAVPATKQPAAASTQPAGTGAAFEATAIRVERDVTSASPGPDGKPGAFRPVKVGDRLTTGTLIRTGLRSKVVLTFGDNTVVLIDRVTLASIDEFQRAGDTRHLQLGLGHGLIRAATVETTLRSEMTIASPVATLSKRGTLDFGMRYEAGTGRYTIWLNDRGLVDAYDWLQNTHRTIQPGQYTTQALLRWIETLTLDRHVTVVDAWGTTGTERQFDAFFVGQGRGVVNPGAGSGNFTDTFTPSNQPGFNPTGTNNNLSSINRPITPGGPLQIVRPEGNFGTGLGH
jgi:hypothetical protein